MKFINIHFQKHIGKKLVLIINVQIQIVNLDYMQNLN